MAQSSSETAVNELRQGLLDCTRDFLVEERGIDRDVVGFDTNFRVDLELDSLDLVEVVMRWEERFGDALDRILESDDVLQLTTARQAIDLAVGILIEAEQS
jgi:acyl carrier protein